VAGGGQVINYLEDYYLGPVKELESVTYGDESFGVLSIYIPTSPTLKPKGRIVTLRVPLKQHCAQQDKRVDHWRFRELDIVR